MCSVFFLDHFMCLNNVFLQVRYCVLKIETKCVLKYGTNLESTCPRCKNLSKEF